jgi:hypothetical protein
MAYEINTLAEFIAASNEERSLSRSDIAPRVLEVEFWQGMVGLPGCIPHAYAYSRSRAEIVSFLREAGMPRGRMAKAGEDCVYAKGYAFECVRNTVGGCF